MACHFMEHWHFLSWMEPWHTSVLVRLCLLWNDPCPTLSPCWPWVDHSFIGSLTRAKAIRSVTWLNRFLYCGRARIFLYKYDMKYKKIWNKLSKKSFKKDLIHYYPQKAELPGTSTWKYCSLQPWALCAVDCITKHIVLPTREWKQELRELPCYSQLNLISICGRLYKSRRVNHDLVSS